MRHNSLYVDLSSVWNPSPSTFVRQQPDYGATSTAFGRRGDLLRRFSRAGGRGRQSSPLAARGEAGGNAGISWEGRERRINGH